MMSENYESINYHWDKTEFPFFLIPKIQKIGINGFAIKDHGGPGFSNLETGAICFELAKKDASLATFCVAHNCIGTTVISELGDEEQRARLLGESLNMEKICCFALTEPTNGSDASDLRTKATKTEGGWLLNGEKRWIGNGTIADNICVWARNPSDGNKI